jgi:integrative and conjugative element protein (TIGR02256 family)
MACKLETRFYDNRKKKLPCETGGVLIGSYDYERKILFIVDFISSPEDSIESPCSYIRGSKGLLGKIRAIEDITAGNLGYVGEWHSHPNDYTGQSQDDKMLMQSIIDYNATQSCPGCMVIVGETHFNVYLESV